MELVSQQPRITYFGLILKVHLEMHQIRVGNCFFSLHYGAWFMAFRIIT